MRIDSRFTKPRMKSVEIGVWSIENPTFLVKKFSTSPGEFCEKIFAIGNVPRGHLVTSVVRARWRVLTASGRDDQTRERHPLDQTQNSCYGALGGVQPLHERRPATDGGAPARGMRRDAMGRIFRIDAGGLA